MEVLGYYAMDCNKDLFQFEWGKDDTFYIIINETKVKSDPDNYEILEIGYTFSK